MHCKVFIKERKRKRILEIDIWMHFLFNGFLRNLLSIITDPKTGVIVETWIVMPNE